jgi:hypothetical protein
MEAQQTAPVHPPFGKEWIRKWTKTIWFSWSSRWYMKRRSYGFTLI